MMAEGMKIGARVEVIGKGLKGTIAYIGTTMFAGGKWIGVVLDIPKGKNNGTVQGKRYFTCEENHGVFVRQQHITPISDSGGSGRPDPASTMKLSASESHLARTPSPSQLQPPSSQVHSTRLPTPSMDKSTLKNASPPQQLKSQMMPASSVEPEKPEEIDIHPATQQSSLSSISALAGGISMAEVESLKAQVKDWKDKFETIRLKRQADRDKLKDLEKFRIQVQQLTEYKSRMSEQNQDLLKQLRDAKKEVKEIRESKEHYMEEMADVHETVEMATLDKEMAEEKVESLQQEVDTLNERVEELQTDLEIMKAEIEDNGTDGAASSYQLKQYEEQISRLKEALLRMRDLSAAEKTEHQNLEKLMEKKTKELEEVLKKKAKISEELETAELTIDELKEQVDAALVAEEMVEQLTDQNLQLEEKLADYEEQVHDLETMNEMNEELQENARETEMELREEVDLARAKSLEAERKEEAANEVVADYQDTIKKFRKHVQELQEANQELRQQQSGDEKSSTSETTPSISTPSPALNYQIKMVETKAAARSIDLDLRKLDAQQANQHVQYLSMFMPGLFNKHGGDRDCVQVMLFVQRISKKAEIVAKHVMDRFEITVPVEKQTDLRGVRGEQLTFGSSLVNTLRELQTLMDRYEISLTQCSVELFQKVGTLHSEMSPHERPLDFLAEQLRRDSLDETTNVDQLKKAVEFFKHLYSVHISRESHSDCWKLLDEHVKQANSLLQNIQINTLRMNAFLKDGQQMSDICILLRDIDTASSDIKQFCKKLRRRMPQLPDTNPGRPHLESLPMLKFGEEVISRIRDSEANLSNVNFLLNEAMSQCSMASSATTDAGTLSCHEMQEIFAKASRKVYADDGNIFDIVRMSLGNVMATMNSLVTSLQEGEFDTVEKRAKVVRPVEKRALAVKADITDSEGLATKLADKDIVIQELRKSLKMKAADIGETKIRIGMLERKLEKSGKVGEEQLSRLQQENDNLKEELKRKEREYDETLDTLQGDIDTLEYEKSELKQRLIAQSKRVDLKTGVGRPSPSQATDIGSILAGAATASGATPGTQVVVKDSPLMQEQIRALQIALCAKRTENYRLLGKDLADRMKRLAPLNIRKRGKTSHEAGRISEVQKLNSNLEKLKGQVICMACPRVIDISKRKPGSVPVGSNSPSQQLLQEQVRLQIAKEKVIELRVKACQLMAATCDGATIKREFASFATPEFTKSLNPERPTVVGSLSLHPKSRSTPGTTPKDLVLEPHQLLRLHNKIINTYSLQPV